MKFSPWIASWAVVLTQMPLCQGQQNNETTQADLSRALQVVPPCALSCLSQSVSNEGCSFSDKACVCVDKYTAIWDDAMPCVTSKCNATEIIYTQGFTEAVCKRTPRDDSRRYNAMNISTGTVAVSMVVIRLLYNRFFSARRELGWDDWAMLWVIILAVPCTTVNSIGLLASGLGRDVWTVTTDQLSNFAKYLYVLETFYMAEMAITKLSLSLFYLKIFPGMTIRRLLVGTCILNAAFGFAFVTSSIFACTPVSRFWTQFIHPEGPGHCINLNVFVWTHAASNIAMDLWMIALPLSQITTLELHWRRKAGVIFMFLMGTFVTVVTILRLQSLLNFSKTINPTWDDISVVWWSTIEVNVGIICTCLPTLRLILVRSIPRICGGKSSKSKYRGIHSIGNRNDKNNLMRPKQFELASTDSTVVDGGEQSEKEKLDV